MQSMVKKYNENMLTWFCFLGLFLFFSTFLHVKFIVSTSFYRPKLFENLFLIGKDFVLTKMFCELKNETIGELFSKKSAVWKITDVAILSYDVILDLMTLAWFISRFDINLASPKFFLEKICNKTFVLF